MHERRDRRSLTVDAEGELRDDPAVGQAVVLDDGVAARRGRAGPGEPVPELAARGDGEQTMPWRPAVHGNPEVDRLHVLRHADVAVDHENDLASSGNCHSMRPCSGRAMPASAYSSVDLPRPVRPVIGKA